jgi:large subunit ribosomal protein L6
MSRVGKKVITVPSGVTLDVSGRTVTAKGPKGQLSYELLEGLEVAVEGSTARVVQTSEEKKAGAAHGLTRALIRNLIEGVNRGFAKTLEINGTGYRAQVQGRKLVLNLGYSHPIEFPLPAGIDASVDQNRITVSGSDKALVGEVAAEIRRFRPPEPYKGKGIKYVDEHIRRKAGKSAGA